MSTTTDSVMRENDKMLDALRHIAEIAHNGGLAGLSENDALCAIRRLTLKYWAGQAEAVDRTRQ